MKSLRGKPQCIMFLGLYSLLSQQAMGNLTQERLKRQPTIVKVRPYWPGGILKINIDNTPRFRYPMAVATEWFQVQSSGFRGCNILTLPRIEHEVRIGFLDPMDAKVLRAPSMRNPIWDIVTYLPFKGDRI